MNKRRKLLLALSGASVVTVWKKPAVDSIVLPAHGSTSCSECSPYDGGWAKVVSQDQFYNCETLTTWEIYLFNDEAACIDCADASCGTQDGNFDVVFAPSVDAANADGCDCRENFIFVETDPSLPCAGTSYRCVPD